MFSMNYIDGRDSKGRQIFLHKDGVAGLNTIQLVEIIRLKRLNFTG